MTERIRSHSVWRERRGNQREVYVISHKGSDVEWRFLKGGRFFTNTETNFHARFTPCGRDSAGFPQEPFMEGDSK